MFMFHVHEPALGQPGAPACRVPEPGHPEQDAASQVELLPVLQYLDLGQAEPGPALDPEGQRQPVGQVNDALVLDSPAVNGVTEPVVAASTVGARVMDVVGARLGCCPARGQVAIAQRAQRFALALFVRAEAVIAQRPGGHQPCPPGPAGRWSIPPVIWPPCRRQAKEAAVLVAYAHSRPLSVSATARGRAGGLPAAQASHRWLVVAC